MLANLLIGMDYSAVATNIISPIPHFRKNGGILSFTLLPSFKFPEKTAISRSLFKLSEAQHSYAVRRCKSVILMAVPPKSTSGKSKKVVQVFKLNLEAGKATPAPPVGPALGSKGINIMLFCKEYNAMTADKVGWLIPAEITVYEDKSFTFILKKPPASKLLLKAAGVEKGSDAARTRKVGKITQEQLRAIAIEKLPDLNCRNIDAAMRTIAGTARSMGIDIDPPLESSKTDA